MTPRPRLTADRLEDRATPDASTVDPTFGTVPVGLIDSFSASGSPSAVYATAVTTDGGVVVAGQLTGTPGTAIKKYLPDGKPDPAFENNGTPGVATVSLRDPQNQDLYESEQIEKIVALPNGGVLIGGTVTYRTANGVSYTNGELVRLDSAGQLDLSFGNKNGFVEYSPKLVTDGNDSIEDLLVLNNGNVVVACRDQEQAATDQYGTIVRLVTAGKIASESVWGPGSSNLPLQAGDTDRAVRLALGTHGQVLVAELGALRNGLGPNNSKQSVLQVTALDPTTGAFSPGFGITPSSQTEIKVLGTVVSTPSSGQLLSESVTPDGRIVLAAPCTTNPGNGPYDAGVWVLNADGSIDQAFAKAGTTQVYADNNWKGNFFFEDAAALLNGDIVLVGTSDDVVNYVNPTQLVVLRPDGTPDPLFDGTGTSTLAIHTSSYVSYGSSVPGATRVVARPDGEFYVSFPVANVQTSPHRAWFGLARVDGFQPLPQIVDTFNVFHNYIIEPGQPLGPLTFDVDSSVTPVSQLVVSATSSNPGLFPAGSIQITYTNGVGQLTATPAAGQTGAATITVSVKDPAGQVVSKSVPVSVILPTPQVISFTPPPAAGYGAAPVPLAATGGGSGNPVTFTVTSGPGQIVGSTLVVTGAGPVVVEADQAGSVSPTGLSNFAPAAPVVVTVLVTPAPLTVTADSPMKVYGAAVPPLTYTLAGLVNGDTAGGVLTGSLTTPATAGSPVGVYAITQGTLGLTTGNYTLTVRGAALTVTPAPLAVAIDNQTKVYGTPLPPLTYTVTGLVNGDTAAGVLTGHAVTAATATSAVGTYAITPGALAANANYQATFTPGTLTVTPAPLSVVIDSQTKVYGAALPPLTFTVTGLVNGDTQAMVLTGSPATPATAGSPVGTYPITRGNLIAGANYTVAFTPGTLTVAPAVLTVAANNLSGEIGSPLPTLTYAVTGLVNGDAPTVVSGVSLTTSAGPTGPAGSYPIIVTGGQAANYVVTDRNGTLTLTPRRPISPTLVGYPQYAAGTDAGGGSVTLYNPDGSVRYTVIPFPASTGGARVAAADFNGDGVADLVVGTGPGGPSHVVILDGTDRHVLFTLDPFEAAFTGGVYVAAGDLTGDGVPDLVITPDQGGGPRVRVFDGGHQFQPVIDFYGIDDPAFRGGARAAVGDVNGDGVGDLVVSAGFQGGPRVAGFDGTSLAGGTPRKIFGDFFAFEPTLRNGVFLTVGDVNGDGYADLIAGGGPGGGPRVTVFDGKTLLANQYATVADFFAGDPNNRGGVRLAVKNLDGDARADLVVGSGQGAGSHVTTYPGASLAGGAPPAGQSFDADPGFVGGVFVG